MSKSSKLGNKRKKYPLSNVNPCQNVFKYLLLFVRCNKIRVVFLDIKDPCYSRCGNNKDPSLLKGLPSSA
jgi:hypothetical protein